MERIATAGRLILAQGERSKVLDRLGLLFDAHHGRLYRLARRLVLDSEEAHDLTQETFLRAAQKPTSVPDGPAAEAWLVQVLVNLCRDRYRRSAVRNAAKQHLPAPLASPNPEATAVAQASVRAALAQLPARRRAIVVLAELEGLAGGEVAQLLGISHVTVRWHLSLGRRELRQLLRPVLERSTPEGGPVHHES